jgi:hypothetical protein
MSLSDVKTPPDYEKQIFLHSDDKNAFKQAEVDSAHVSDSDVAVLSTEWDIATHIVSVHDDPTLNPWTIRAFVIGLGLSAFGGVLGKSGYNVYLSCPALKHLNSGDILLQTSTNLSFFWLPTHLYKLSTANRTCLDVVLGHYFIYSWYYFGDSNTADWILTYP